MLGDRPSDRDRIVAGGIAGAACGSVVGLIVFEGLVFVPPLAMLAGGACGMVLAARLAGLRMTLSDLLEIVFEGETARTPAHAPAAEPRSPTAPATGSQPGVRRRARPPVRLPSLPPPDRPIDLNTADLDDLSRLPGVGWPGARRIVAFRDVHGPFASLEELEQIWGMDSVRISQFAQWARLSPEEDSESPAPGAAEPAVPA